MINNLIWLYSIFFIIILLHAKIDSILIKEGNAIKHGWETILPSILPFVAIVMLMPSHWYLFKLSLVFDYWALRFLIFDLSLNLFRGLPWDYKPKIKNYSSEEDRIDSHYKHSPYVIKIGFFIIFNFSTYIIYQYYA